MPSPHRRLSNSHLLQLSTTCRLFPLPQLHSLASTLSRSQILFSRSRRTCTSSPTASSRTLFFHSSKRSVKASTRSVRYLESWSISQNLSPTTVSVSPRFQFARNDRRTFGTALPPRTGPTRKMRASSTRTLGDAPSQSIDTTRESGRRPYIKGTD